MRILHTADWHLGRVFHGVHLTEDQSHLLEQLANLIKAEKIDVMLISGDIYDRSVPPADAVNLLDDFLSRVSLDCKIPIILIAGNHDSPDRLGFGYRLMTSQGVHVVGRLTPKIEPIIVKDDFGPVYFSGLPFSEPAIVRERLGDKKAIDYNTAMSCMTKAALGALSNTPKNVRKVILAHAFIAGCDQTDSERPISVGGTGAVDNACFNEFNYVALGHLHRPQAAGADNIRYAGSLMKYSFNESGHKKGVTIVELDEMGKASIETVSLNPKRDVRRIEGNLAQVLKDAQSEKYKEDYFMVTLTDDGALLDPMSKLREVYPNVLHIDRPFVTATNGLAGPSRDYKNKGIVELFDDFFNQVTDIELNEEQKDVFSDILGTIDLEGGA